MLIGPKIVLQLRNNGTKPSLLMIKNKSVMLISRFRIEYLHIHEMQMCELHNMEHVTFLLNAFLNVNKQ